MFGVCDVWDFVFILCVVFWFLCLVWLFLGLFIGWLGRGGGVGFVGSFGCGVGE